MKLASIFLMSTMCAQAQLGAPRTLLALPKPVAGETLLLDSVGSAFVAVDINRKLRAAYTGPSINVIRTSDGTTNDIGWSGNFLDTNSIISFVGTGTGLVHIAYDQSGNARNFVAFGTGFRPRIYDSTVGFHRGTHGHPVMWFDGTDLLTVSGTPDTAVPFTYFTAVSSTNTVNNANIISGSGSTRIGLAQATGPLIRMRSGSNLNSPTITEGLQYLVTCRFVSGTSDSLRLNAGSATTGDAGDATSGTSMSVGGSSAAEIRTSLWIFYAASLSTGDEDTVRNNINAFYNIY